MSDDDRKRAGERVRGLVLSLERLAARGLASGAVEGAAEELPGLTRELAELFAKLKALLDTSTGLLAEQPPEKLRTFAEATARGAVQGFVAGTVSSWPALAETAQGLVARLDHLLDRSATLQAQRAVELAAPGTRARLAASSGVDGAMKAVQENGPALEALLENAGKSLARGITGQLKEELAGLDGRRLRLLGQEAAAGIVTGARRELRAPVLLGAGVVGGLLGFAFLVRLRGAR